MVTCQRVAKHISVIIGELKAEIDFLVVNEVFVGVLIEVLEMHKIYAHINLGSQYVYLHIRRKSVRVDLELSCIIDQEQSDE